MQAVVFLEWICRLCKSDTSNGSLSDFARELNKIEPHYFTTIPSRCRVPGGFDLPSIGDGAKDRLLLSMLFYLLRNGLSHVYQQINIPLLGGECGISLFGVQPGDTLNLVVKYRDRHHLSFATKDSEIWIFVHPGILFLDFKAAFENARLLHRNLTQERLRVSLPTEKILSVFPAKELASSLQKQATVWKMRATTVGRER